jgi:hypothetical protein
MEQDGFCPYDDAEPFLASLKERGFYVIVASHRQKGTLGAAERWLRKNKLTYDRIHLSYDKTILFDDCWGVVDDSPVILRKARNAGIVRVGLKNPWNESEDHPLFDNLGQVLRYIDKETAARNGCSALV